MRTRRPGIGDLIIGVLMMGLAGSVCAEVKRPMDQQLATALTTICKDHAGEVGVAIKNLETGDFFEYQPDQPMPTASLIKFPLMIAAYREVDAGRLDLKKMLPLQDSDRVPGSGVLTEHFSDGAQLPLRDYVRLMIRYSDNTATNVVADAIGLKKTAEVAESLGCSNTKLHSKVYRGDTTVFPERSKEFGLGSTSAGEMIRLLEMLHDGSVASQESCDAMLEHLKSCADGSMVGRLLPKNVVYAHKTGAVANCRTDAGIVYTSNGPVAVCVLTAKNEDQTWEPTNEAEIFCAEVGKAIIDRFGSEAASTDLQVGSYGKLVEALQRTLNSRLTPSPNLAVDGDFGPASKRAVVRFQQENGLEADGIVTDAMWAKLGTLLDTDAPVPAPEIVNAERLPVREQPALDAPPVVTCASWVIGDPQTGELLYLSEADEPREAASTTKIMTAFVVLEYAKEHPEMLEEIVTFSVTADNTVGSTSAVRAGEQLSVRHLLYGLLLPSGNDASVGLAEHVGAKLVGGSEDGTAAYEAFVARMNEMAADVGMKNTVYKNTHGLPDEENVTTASDLFRLASRAMQHELFREIVSTRQFGCTLTSTKGYRRNVIWKNTNRLLGIAGYYGVKTGTTSAAGACLVSCGEREGDRLMAVVLGSSSSAARYSDTRNLYRWAWGQRAAE